MSGVGEHATQGTLLTLMCEVSGARPAARIEWYNGTQRLTTDDNNIQVRSNTPIVLLYKKIFISFTDLVMFLLIRPISI